jgi:hypothetical protein
VNHLVAVFGRKLRMGDAGKNAAETRAFQKEAETDFVGKRIFDPRQDRSEQESDIDGDRRHLSMLPAADARMARTMSILHRETGPHCA